MTFDPDLTPYLPVKLAESKDSPEDPSDEEDLGELQVAEYLVFLLSLETYLRWLEEKGEHDTSGESHNPHDDADGVELDPVGKKGMRLLLRIETQMAEAVTKFVVEQLPSESQKRMFARGMGRSIRTPSGVVYRAYQVQQCLERGGAATLRAVFDTNRAIRLVKNVMVLSDNESATVAFPEFASYPMSHALIRGWLDDAADWIKKQTPEGTAPLKVKPRAVDQAVAETSGVSAKLLATQAVQLGARGTEVLEAGNARQDQLNAIESKATEAAKRAMDAAGEEDRPLTRSEVIGVATAAALATSTDPQDTTNIPASLREALGKDAEQLAAALTDGRVVVAAGAGSGKSRTAVARVAYLVKDRGVAPSRIILTSFGSKAAADLRQKVSKELSQDQMSQMKGRIATIHSIAGSIVRSKGTPRQVARVGIPGKSMSGAQIRDAASRAVQSIWRKEHPIYDADTGTFKDGPAPSLKGVGAIRSVWKGNGVTPQQAKMEASTGEEATAAEWYELYEGLKGNIPGWSPSLKSDAAKAVYTQFMARYRPDGLPVGDFDDHLEACLEVLETNPQARKQLQAGIDHILVDECQDLNQTQAKIFERLAEHIQDGDGRSFWQIGDQKQCIYSFRGAKPELFEEKQNNPNWKNRQITTNYRCPPAVVGFANQMIANNAGDADFVAKPRPGRAADDGSVVMLETPDEAGSARVVINAVQARVQESIEQTGAPGYWDHAVLARTNRELDYYETALILRGIPYARKGAKATFGTPEMKGVLGALQVVQDQDPKSSQEALVQVMGSPFKGFKADPSRMGRDKDYGIGASLRKWANQMGLQASKVTASAAMADPGFRRILAQEQAGGKQFGKGFEEKLRFIEMMAEDLQELGQVAADPGTSMQDVMSTILAFRAADAVPDPRNPQYSIMEPVSYRDALLKANQDKETDEAEEPSSTPGEVVAETDVTKLGGLSFIYDLMTPNPDDPNDAVNDPRTLGGFTDKIARIKEKAAELSIDITAFEKDLQDRGVPLDQWPKPPGVYLGTIHATKGAQWESTYVLMPEGTFPMKLRIPPEITEDHPDYPRWVEKAAKQLEDERRLGYVAVTRTERNMHVLCPKQNNNKPAGISQFVYEMGLRKGENIGAPQEAEAITDEVGAEGVPVVDTSEGTTIKTADWEEEY